MRRPPRRRLLPLSLLPLLLAPGAPLGATQTQADAPEESSAAEEVDEEPEPPKLSKRHEALFGTEGELPLEWANAFDWRSIGPANMGGRILDIAVHPQDPSTYWVGTATGGILKTTNQGVTYDYLFQDQAVSSIGALAVSPADPDVLWVGTGEPNPRNSSSWGNGVYRSTDGGETFAHVGLSDSFQIGAIVAHPVDPGTAYVAALGRLWGPNDERGLFKTEDGGDSWERVLFVDEDTGAIDVVLKPDDPETLLAATYQRRRDGFDTNDPAEKWGPGSGLWRSTDGGASWERLGTGLPTVTWGRVGLDWYQGDPNVVYAIIETERITQLAEDAAFLGLTGSDGDQVGVRVRRLEEDGPAATAGLEEDDLLVTMDGELLTTWDGMVRDLRDRKAGQTVSLGLMRGKESQTIEVTFGSYPTEEEDGEERARPRTGPFSSGLGGQVQNVQDQQGEDGHEYGGVYRSDDAGQTWERVNSVNPRPMYYSQIRVDPSDDNYVYVLGTSLYRSSDGGLTFTSDGAGGGVHVDHHSLWIDPRDGRRMILGNDGGIYLTYDRMETWDHHNHVALGQFYAVEADRRLDYRVFGGLQDNGSWGAPVTVSGGSGPANEDWFRVGGGDGFVCRVDPEDPDLIYYESQNGGLGRRHLGTGAMGFFRPRGSRDVRLRFNWKTPFLLSNHNSRIYYTAGNHVFRSLDRGDDLRRISPEITHTDRGAATALAESPREPDHLYVGTDDGALWRTRDGGTTWSDLFDLNALDEVEVEALPEGVDVTNIAALTVDGTADTFAVELVLDGADPQAEANGNGAAGSQAEAAVEAELEPDALGGRWQAIAAAEGATAPAIELRVRMDESGALGGELDSVLGTGTVRKGSFDPETGAFELQGVGDGVGFTVRGSVEEDGLLGGRMTAGGGMVDVPFRATRVEDASGKALEPKRSAAVAVAASETVAVQETEPAEEEDDDEPSERKFLEDTIDQLLPGRFHVSSLVASRHKTDRVYVTFDGHRSDEDRPFVFRSDDGGTTWDALHEDLPDAAGSARVIVEDPQEEDLLFLGTEFGAFVSLDRGESWTRANGDLPTVPIHDFSINEASGEIVAGTHGRSLWVLDMAPLREMTGRTLSKSAHLYQPGPVIVRDRAPERGRTLRRFVGEARPSGVLLTYHLNRKAREVELFVVDAKGERVATLDTTETKGLHRVRWSLRGSSSDGSRRRARRASSGSYEVVLVVDGEEQRVPLVIP